MATHHSRHPSTHSKRPLPVHARPSKPVPLSKRSPSYSASKKLVHREESTEDEESMATSFLNFCTTCEKQIIVPSNFVLYCSESCRRKDTEKQLSYPFDYSPPPTPTFEDQFRDIVPPRSPTFIGSKRNSLAFSDLSSDENTATATSTSASASASATDIPNHDSEASRYLRQFQATTYSGETTVRPHRPLYKRASTSQATFAPPSLSHTPASSVSYSLPYTPSMRPLPPRKVSLYGAKTIELVTPWAHLMTAPPSPPKYSPPKYSMKSKPTCERTSSTIEGEILYEKSPIPEVSMANGSLGRLLATSAQ
ncbi:hypothetical protein P280DRAFT_489503 [Massarina eburnea CBS 473.64]|uniref:Life-span regulatory factor-domain-containing protein n=1 Tax=Massarina eburnea CBS 473.64 TaxID=1395130 RepID=A0A6A6S0X3_9PLEO|nr:hypothetical protein P280DRAFT_489503 [Massarina eburnea CBS 473.64]